MLGPKTLPALCTLRRKWKRSARERCPLAINLSGLRRKFVHGGGGIAPAIPQQVTSTRRKVTGMFVPAAPVFCALNSASSSACKLAVRPLFSAAA